MNMLLITVYIITAQIVCVMLTTFQYFSKTEESSVPTFYRYNNKTFENSIISYGTKTHSNEYDCIRSCQRSSLCKSINMWKTGDVYSCENLGTTSDLLSDSVGWHFTMKQVWIIKVCVL